jgi:hypothetical protein
MPKRQQIVPARVVSKEELARIAYVIGESSAAQKCLDDMKIRLDAGQDVICFEFQRTFYVGPKEMMDDINAKILVHKKQTLHPMPSSGM